MLTHLSPRKSALLVVDIQERLMPVIHERAVVEKNAQLLIKTARTLQMPLLATTQYAARIGALVPEVAKEIGSLEPIDKMEFGCFSNSVFLDAVGRLPEEVEDLIVCGVETHICIYQTVLGGLQAGYRMWVPADAVSSRTPKNYRTGLGRMREIGASIVNTELVIYDLLGRAGTPEFKALLPFLK